MRSDGVAAARTMSERVHAALPRIEYRRATTDHELEAIFRLRYEAYRREQALEERESRLLDDKFDGDPNALQIGVLLDGRLASCLRVHVATAAQCSSPAVDNFPDMLVDELARGKVIVDPNRFIVDFASSRACPELPYLTLRLAYMAAEHFEADLVTATVRREHQAFYRRELLMTQVCPPRPYPTLTKLIGLMMIDFKRTGREILKRRPFYASSAAEREALFSTQGAAELGRRSSTRTELEPGKSTS